MANDEAGAVSRLHDGLSLHEGQIVVVVRLERAPHYNYAPGVVVRRVDDDGRLGVELLHGRRQTLSIRRSNLLRADHEEDRVAILTQAVWERQLELRVARNYLLDRLRGEEGLALHIASFFPARQTMALTTGFAMGCIVPTWSCATLSTAGRLHWRPIHEQRDGRLAVFGASRVRDGLVRIDCAVVDIGSGRFVVAGGCDDHPSRARTFFKSAFIYDALTHAATPLPDMPCARHGCGGALVDGKVYVVGGGYADLRGAGTVCSVLDLATHTWSPLPSAEFDEETLVRLSRQLELEEMLVDEVLRRRRNKARLAAMQKLQVLQRPIAFVPHNGCMQVLTTAPSPPHRSCSVRSPSYPSGASLAGWSASWVVSRSSSTQPTRRPAGSSARITRRVTPSTSASTRRHAPSGPVI